jgi:hypothetical protein
VMAFHRVSVSARDQHVGRNGEIAQSSSDPVRRAGRYLLQLRHGGLDRRKLSGVSACSGCARTQVRGRSIACARISCASAPASRPGCGLQPELPPTFTISLQHHALEQVRCRSRRWSTGWT